MGIPKINPHSRRMSDKRDKISVHLRLHSASVGKKECNKLLEETPKKSKKIPLNRSMNYLKAKQSPMIPEIKKQRRVNKSTLKHASAKIDKELLKNFIEITKDPNAKLNFDQFCTLMKNYGLIKSKPSATESQLLEELWDSFSTKPIDYSSLTPFIHSILRTSSQAHSKYFTLYLNKMAECKKSVGEPMHSHRPELSAKTARLAIKARSRRSSREKGVESKKSKDEDKECTFAPRLVRKRYSTSRNKYEKDYNLAKKVMKEPVRPQAKVQPRLKPIQQRVSPVCDYHIQRMKRARQVILSCIFYRRNSALRWQDRGG
eukprot:TRINITY_DN12348_c0_g2_i1.p1 TRINITY_DN12348_c0_g2~~TRINITY_DN12348_c0_g2_i1.p1  ORF type:complete len:317 (-),score=56.30 TRINITY_DN12348_c0_g2_i1:395-1345(-)